MKEMIYLIGFMGAGKSTIAPVLAKNLGLDWVDTDELIEEKVGLSIPEIFEYYGEERFREIERGIIKEVSRSDAKVVAVGGGAPMNETNWHLMKATGTVVYLEIGPGEALDRIGSDGNRPLLSELTEKQKEKKIQELLKSRHPRYNKADHVVPCNGKGTSAIAKEITNSLLEENEQG
ncbi:MAG: shikimate kinase [Candidatus Bipolaricaulia bacterium]